ncbi:MAG: hypothetical protein WC823_03695 [Parcubacteria group bacterium]|jgi:hypothetical protein
MNRKISPVLSAGVIIAFALIFGISFWLVGRTAIAPTIEKKQPPITKKVPDINNDMPMRACTEEAKICPDGSAVARTGENCEFAPCPQMPGKLTQAEAQAIAEKNCLQNGDTLGAGTYNENSKTWWFDAKLKNVRPGCNPACVVNEETRSAEINWRCTGLKR